MVGITESVPLPCFIIDHDAVAAAAEFGKTRQDILMQKCVDAWQLDSSGPTNVHLTSSLDAAFKWRPKPSEVAELGPEFQEYWESYFANAPDKPVLWFGVGSALVLGLTSLSKYSLLPSSDSSGVLLSLVANIIV